MNAHAPGPRTKKGNARSLVAGEIDPAVERAFERVQNHRVEVCIRHRNLVANTTRISAFRSSTSSQWEGDGTARTRGNPKGERSAPRRAYHTFFIANGNRGWVQQPPVRLAPFLHVFPWTSKPPPTSIELEEVERA